MIDYIKSRFSAGKRLGPILSALTLIGFAGWARLPATAQGVANRANGAEGASLKPVNTMAAPGYRADPMRPWWDVSSRKPSVLDFLAPVRIAVHGTAAGRTAPEYSVQVAPTRRLAGVLTGAGVYALVVGPYGRADVVRPGQVLDDGYRVDSIGRDTVVISKASQSGVAFQSLRLTDGALR
jgi:hypothetical protein